MSILSSVRTVLEMIKFEHTLFALPFALLGMLLAAEGWPSGSIAVWIVVAMVGARSAAMGWNRLADSLIDARNPRTAQRALPAGKVTPLFVALFVALSLGVLLLAAFRLNPLCVRLYPVAVVILLGYSYCKRFTSLSHLVLGLALAGAPLGAWIAVRGSVEATPLALAAVVLLWVAGFDILYALQDLEFDRQSGLYSIPARIGVVPSLVVSALFHVAMLGILALLPRVYPPGLGGIYWAGFAGCVAMIAYQHAVVRPKDLSRLNAAFFTANGVLSVWLLVATAADVLL